MSRPRKFKAGRKFGSVEAAVRWMLAGGWSYAHGRPIHPGWTRSWSVSLLMSYVTGGHLRRAVPNIPRRAHGN